MRNLGLIALLAALVSAGCSQQDTDKVSSDAKNMASSAGQKMSGYALAEKVNTALKLRKDVDASTFNVSAKDGVVTITGTAKSAEEKTKVHDIAMNTTGVEKVDDSGVMFVTSVAPK